MKYSLQRNKNKGTIPKNIIKYIKKNAISISLKLTALASVCTIFWATNKLVYCTKLNNFLTETNYDIDELEEFITKLQDKDINDLSKEEIQLIQKYRALKKYSLANKNIESKEDIKTEDKIVNENKENKMFDIIYNSNILSYKNEREVLERNRKEEKTLDFSEYLELTDDIGSRKDEDEERLTESLLNSFTNSSLKWGIDKEILIAMGKQEMGLVNKSSGSAKGMMQIENVNRNNKYNAYNYLTNSSEVVSFSKLNLENIDDNIDAASVMLQELINRYSNNINIAIHAYNYGYPIIDRAIKNVMNETGKTKEEVTYDDIHPYLEAIHKNPSKYLSNWGRGTYGDGMYTNNVKDHSRNRLVYAIHMEDDTKVLSIYDLTTGESIKNFTNKGLKDNIYYDQELNRYFKFEDIVNSINSKNIKTKTF